METKKEKHDSLEWLKNKRGLDQKEINGLIKLSIKLEITMESLIRRIAI